MDEATFQRMLADGQKRIERLKRQNEVDENGILRIPFVCYGCEEKRTDFCLMTGDGAPMCQRCFDGSIPQGAAHEV